MRLVEHPPQKKQRLVYTVTPIPESTIRIGSNGRKRWADLCDNRLISFARWHCRAGHIDTRRGLKQAEHGLYLALEKRKLIGEIGLPDSQKDYRDWTGLGREEMVSLVKRFIAENGIGGKKELEEVDSGMYQALLKRNLFDDVGLQDRKRNWAKMGREGLVDFAKRLINEKRIGGRAQLQNADMGLYRALRLRRLLDAVFSDAESSNHIEAVGGVLDALESFGDEK